MYLDEMLTRELIKLDDIETEGKENVRQARKQAIKSIQDSISLLESKVPLPEQQQVMDEAVTTEQQPQEENSAEAPVLQDKPDQVAETSEESAVEQKAIPLPPPSPLKVAPEATSEEMTLQSESADEQQTSQNVQILQPESANVVAEQATTDAPPAAQKVEENQTIGEAMDSNTCQPLNDQAMEVRQISPVKELPSDTEKQQSESQALIINEQSQETKDQEAKNNEVKDTAISTSDNSAVKKEPPPVPAKPTKSPKKAKKTKKEPVPVSETAIPLPAPGQSI